MIEKDPDGKMRKDFGAKMDAGKDMWSLLPLRIICGIVKVLTFGAKQYTKEGWKHVNNGKERYYSAMMRHWYKMTVENKYIDDGPNGTQQPHWACFCTNAIFIAWFMLQEHEKNK